MVVDAQYVFLDEALVATFMEFLLRYVLAELHFDRATVLLRAEQESLGFGLPFAFLLCGGKRPP